MKTVKEASDEHKQGKLRIHDIAKINKMMTDLEKDNVPKKVAPAMFDGQSKTSVHPAGCQP